MTQQNLIMKHYYSYYASKLLNDYI